MQIVSFYFAISFSLPTLPYPNRISVARQAKREVIRSATNCHLKLYLTFNNKCWLRSELIAPPLVFSYSDCFIKFDCLIFTSHFFWVPFVIQCLLYFFAWNSSFAALISRFLFKAFFVWMCQVLIYTLFHGSINIFECKSLAMLYLY